MRKLYINLSFLFLILTLLAAPVYAELDVSDFLDSNVPESWNQAPKTASELGIAEFDQSPILDKKVERGELPPVEERLPKDPIVIEPYEDIGKYGGTFDVWGVDLEDFTLGWNVIAPQGDTPLHP
ncbi:MAG: hypothetical protein ACOCRX_12350, partial [Candidatus Woesearchaeota archaeon]